VYAYLGIPRKAWPGLLRMPEVPRTSRGSEAALEDFVMLVRRWGLPGAEGSKGELGADRVLVWCGHNATTIHCNVPQHSADTVPS
jgi:hypothetical protein